MRYKMRNVKLPLLHLLCWTIGFLGSPALAQDSVNPKQEKAALKKAKKLRKKLVRGADFGSLARKHSDDPGSAMAGGELGLVSWGQFVPEYEEAVTQLETGELSEPVRTPFGYHLIQLIERQGGQFDTRHILVKF